MISLSKFPNIGSLELLDFFKTTVALLLKEDVFFYKILRQKTNNGGDSIGAAEWANYLQSDTQPALCSKKLLREISFPKFALSPL